MSQYMLIMRSTAEALEASKTMDFEEIINAMGRYNESMMEAGVMTGGAGLADASQGVVIDFSSEPPLVTDGPYGEVHELFNGYWTISVATQEEAVEWAKRCPLGPGSKLEVRRITDESDFADFADNEFIEKEKGWAEQLAEKRDQQS
jgi:hypothetical protein